MWCKTQLAHPATCRLRGADTTGSGRCAATQPGSVGCMARILPEVGGAQPHSPEVLAAWHRHYRKWVVRGTDITGSGQCAAVGCTAQSPQEVGEAQPRSVKVSATTDTPESRRTSTAMKMP